MNSNTNNCLESAGNKYLKALEKTKEVWHSYCGCKTPGLESKCHSCPYFIEFVKNMQNNLPEFQEYLLISPPPRSCNEETRKLCLEMYDHGYSIERIAELLGLGNYKTIREWIHKAGKLKTIANATKALQELVVKLYQQGKTPVEIETETGISADSIRNYVLNIGIARPKKIYSKEEKEVALNMWLKGCTDKEIVSATGIAGHMVREYARENNIKREVRKVGAPSKYSEEVKQKCLRLRTEGKSYFEIQNITDVSTTTINNWCKNKGNSH